MNSGPGYAMTSDTILLSPLLSLFIYRIEETGRMDDNININLWAMITHPLSNFNGDLAEPVLMLGLEWVRGTRKMGCNLLSMNKSRVNTVNKLGPCGRQNRLHRMS